MKYTSFLIVACCFMMLVSCSKETTSTYERFYFRHDGADLAVEVNGDIASDVFILLLHGGPGGSGQEYNTGLYSEILERDYAMVYLDQRGQGASKGGYEESTITLQQFSEDVNALALFLKQKYGDNISLFLMGHSWGGTTGIHALLNTGVQNELKGWIEVDGAHDIPMINKEAIKLFIEIGNDQIAQGKNTDRWQEIVDFATGVDTNNISTDEGGQINQYGFEAESLLSEIKSSTGGTAPYTFSTSPLATLTGLIAGNLTAGAITPETEQTSMTGELHKITIPTLLAWGKYDFVVPPALGETAYENISSAEKELVIFDFSGHSPMDNEAQLFADIVVDFVEKHK